MSRTLAILLVLGASAAAGPAKVAKKPAPAVTTPWLAPDSPGPVISDLPDNAEVLANLAQSDPDWPKYAFLVAADLETGWHLQQARASQLADKMTSAPPDRRAALDKQRLAALAQGKRMLARAVSLLATAVTLPAALRSPKLDEALFRLGTLYQQSGQPVEARRTFQHLIKDFPLSRFVPDAFLAFGDYFFEQNDMASARAFYEKVAQFPKARVYAYALYKTGWVDFNLGDATKALQDFVATVAASTDKTQATLHNAALKDLVLVYAKVGAPDKASAFFQRIAAGQARALLERLAEGYADDGNSKAAAIVRQAILDLGGQGKPAAPTP